MGAAADAVHARAARLRQTVLETLTDRAAALSEPPLRAGAAFGAIGELSARTLYELDDPKLKGERDGVPD